MKLEKGKFYRVNGEKLYFQEAKIISGEQVLLFSNFGITHLIQEVLIESLDEIVDVIDTQAQAMQKDAFEEFMHSGLIDGKKPRTKYVYKNILGVK